MAANQSNQREKEIFECALDFESSEERLGYVKSACADDAALLARVRALLQAHDEASRFLPDTPGADLENTLATHPSDDAAPGDRIGSRYKLLQKIGEGGCGVVYMAEQEEPVRRRVALKVIKLGMDTKSVIARFESERQALALMDHPNIAKIFDAGTTEGRLSSRPEDGDRNVAAPISAGRPYFVMELVRGVKITEYCDQQSLPTRDRLDLFIKVCQAIQHAHQKGIIHRDIKPSNILVTLHDGVAVPKVIDFGIAKATADQRLTDKTFFTALEQFIGTPAYMSPEQAEMSGLDIDTRCDIYSLGVLLYELLTGKTPFDSKELLASGIDAMRKTIREKEPMRPSTKLSQTLVAADVRRLSSKSEMRNPKSEEDVRASSRRLLRLKETISLLRGDVDWIVMKCLEKDRARRYETANGLASDIQRHLNNEAVLARPPSAAYRFQKLVRRNKLAFAAVAAVTLTLIAGLSFSTWAFLREAAQRRTAHKSAEQARQAEQKAESAAATITRNLYFAEMNLAGNAAAEPGGISRMADLTTKWLPEKGAADLRGWEWYYLRSLLHQDLFTLGGHTDEVKSVAWSPDGKRLASGSADNAIKIWDAASRQVTLTLTEHTNRVNSVAWSPDGKRLASGSEDNTIKVWDAVSGQVIHTLIQHTNVVNSVTWSPDGKRLASGSGDRTIKIWDADSGTNIHTLSGHSGLVLSVAWSPDGKRLASSSNDGTIKVWDVDGGQVIHTLTGHVYWVPSVSWSPEGKRLASGGADFKVRVWDAVGGTLISSLSGHFDVVRSVSWSPDGKRLASGCEDNTIKVWDATSGRNTFTHRGHNNYVFSVAWSPDGRQMVSGSRDNTIKIWDATSEETLTLPDHTNGVNSVSWSPDGKRLASGNGENNTINLYDATSGQVTLALRGHSSTVHSVAWSPDGKFLASGSWDKTIKVWNAVSGQTIHDLRDERSGGFSGVAWSRDGKHLAAGAFDKTVWVWNAVSGQSIQTLRGHSGGLLSVSWSPDGKRLASASFDGTVKVWDAASGHESVTLRGHTLVVPSVAWSPDGKRLASGGYDGTIKIWDARKGYALERE